MAVQAAMMMDRYWSKWTYLSRWPSRWESICGAPTMLALSRVRGA